MTKKKVYVKTLILGLLILGMLVGSGVSPVSALAKASISQYANDDPVSWDTGNLGASKSTYYEGDSIPYRAYLTDINAGSNTLSIEWDTTKAGLHAIDYLTSYNRSVTPNPCLGLTTTICSLTPHTFPIPIDPQVAAQPEGVIQIPGDFTLYGGTITEVSIYTFSPPGLVGDTSASVSITFNNPTDGSDLLLLWGGHIATRADWGMNDAATNISGSPYHTRLLGLNGSGGNQDLALSAAAVIFPGRITIIKETLPASSGTFGFTASPLPLTDFTLPDGGVYTKIFDGIEVFQPYTIVENPTDTWWSLTSIICTVESPNGGGYTVNLPLRSVLITMNEGEYYTCTYLNTLAAGFLKIVKVAEPNLPIDFTFNMGSGQVSTDAVSTWTLSGSSNTLDTYGIIAFEPGTTYDLTEVLPIGWSLGSASCVLDAASTGTLVGTTITDFTIETGKTTTCTFTNTRPVDLTIDKTDYDYLSGYATRGGTINYMITVTNADLVNSASSVVVTDVLDINISVDSDPWFTEGIQFSPIINRNGVLDPSVVCAVTGADLMGYGGTITCPLGTMTALEVVTIEFPATVDYDTPIESAIETGLCTQNPDQQGTEAVDICNTVSVYSPDELPAQTGNNTDSDPKDVGKPTSVDVYNFTATGLIRTIKLEWETAHAHQHLGFNLYRASSLNGARTKITKINDELITENMYLDYVNGKTTYYYWLQSVDVNGLTESFGPVEAQVLKRYK